MSWWELMKMQFANFDTQIMYNWQKYLNSEGDNPLLDAIFVIGVPTVFMVGAFISGNPFVLLIIGFISCICWALGLAALVKYSRRKGKKAIDL